MSGDHIIQDSYIWPTAKIAVMGGAQAAKTLLQIKV